MFDKQQIEHHLDQIDINTQQIRDLLTDVTEPPPTQSINVDSAEELHAALAEGGNIIINAGLTMKGNFKFSKPAIVKGMENVGLIGDGRPALDVPINVHDTGFENVQLAVTRYEVVCLLGRNELTQTDLSVVPTKIKIDKLFISGHRGKRGVEINAKDVVIANSTIKDLYDPEKLDSQCILIMNTPGNIVVSNCHLEGAVENLMVGGDSMKLTGDVHPTNILVENCMFTKDLAWKGNTAIPVKNLFELKDGHNVTVRNCKFSNSWKSAQDGYCFTFTPRRGGTLRNVLIENCEVENVGAICNITGFDDPYPNLPLTQLKFKGGKYRTNSAEMGGTGRFGMVTNGAEYVIIDGIDCEHTGNSFFGVEDKDPVGQLHIVNSRWNYGTYGIRIGGYSDGDNQLGIVKDLKIEGNTILGAKAAFKARYPNNTYA